MKKRLLILLFSLAMILCMSGCTKKKEKKTVSLDEFTIPAVETQEQAEEETKKGTKKEKTNVQNEDDDAKDDSSSGKGAEKVSGKTYENESFGIHFTAPDGFTMFSESELANLANGVASTLPSQVDTTYEMYALDASSGTSVNVTIETILENMSMTDYLKAAKAGMDKITIYDNITWGEVKQGKLGGKKFYIANISMEYQQIPVYTQIYLMKKGNKMMVITFGYTDGFEDRVQRLKEGFK